MKNLLPFFFLFFSTGLYAQKISGIYTGTLFNDTTKMLQHYEIGLSEYKGKITGYSYTTFVANDTFYYGIRSVKAYIKDDQLIVQDIKLLANNFPEDPAKGVKRILVIPLNAQDSVVSLNGTWETNKTKQFYSVSGSLDLTRSNDSAKSELITHLKDLKIISDPFSRTIAVAKSKPVKVKTEPEIKTQSEGKPAAIINSVAENKPLPFDKRKEALPQIFDVEGDSLILSFYDNGIVDGDSISVYMNGKNILPSTKLTAIATKKTIHFNEAEARIILVAENLGTIPPNTGLLVIKDGEKIYQVNFRADMGTNSAIIIRKKQN